MVKFHPRAIANNLCNDVAPAFGLCVVPEAVAGTL